MKEENEVLYIPEIGSKWFGRGCEYEVIIITNEHCSDVFPIDVVYKGDDSRIWSMDLTAWHETMVMKLLSG